MSCFKTFCLNCLKTNACECGTNSFQFHMSYKLRPPKVRNKKIKKKVWQQFFKDCPQFVNCVPEELYDKFNDFVINRCGFEGKCINGKDIPLVRD